MPDLYCLLALAIVGFMVASRLGRILDWWFIDRHFPKSKTKPLHPDAPAGKIHLVSLGNGWSCPCACRLGERPDA